jgi:hypothetical protein
MSQPCKPIKGQYYHCWLKTLYVGIARYDDLGELYFLDSTIPKGMSLLYLDFKEVYDEELEQAKVEHL